MQDGVEDVVFCFLRFPSGLAAHLHLSWLDPHKERRFTVVGSKKMATFDDMELERKLTVYDKGFDEDFAPTASTSPARATSTARACPTRSRCGSSAAHFVECVRDGRHAALRRRERPARGAGAGGAAALAWRRAGVLSRLTALRAALGEGVDCRHGGVGGHVVVHAGTVLGGGRDAQRRRGGRQAARAGRALERAARGAGPGADRRRRAIGARGGGAGRRPDRRRLRGGDQAHVRERADDRRRLAWWAAAPRWTTT